MPSGPGWLPPSEVVVGGNAGFPFSFLVLLTNEHGQKSNHSLYHLIILLLVPVNENMESFGSNDLEPHPWNIQLQVVAPTNKVLTSASKIIFEIWNVSIVIPIPLKQPAFDAGTLLSTNNGQAERCSWATWRKLKKVQLQFLQKLERYTLHYEMVISMKPWFVSVYILFCIQHGKPKTASRSTRCNNAHPTFWVSISILGREMQREIAKSLCQPMASYFAVSKTRRNKWRWRWRWSWWSWFSWWSWSRWGGGGASSTLMVGG